MSDELSMKFYRPTKFGNLLHDGKADQIIAHRKTYQEGH